MELMKEDIMSNDKPNKKSSVNFEGLQEGLKNFYSELEESLKETYPDGGYELLITSAKRDSAIGKSGNKSHHLSGNAFDLRADKKVYDYLYNTPKGVGLLAKHGLGLLDETSKETLAKTGGTGAHLHIGKDSKYVAQTKQRFEKSTENFEYVPMGSNGEHHEGDGHNHTNVSSVETENNEGSIVKPFSMEGIDPEKYKSFLLAYKKEEDKAEIKEKKTKESDARKAIEEAKKQKALYETKKRESFMNLMAEMSKEDEVRKPQMKQESPQQDFQMLTMQKSLPELPSIHRLPEFQDGGEQISYYQNAGTAQALTKKQKREQDYYKLTMMMREGYKHLSPDTGKQLTPGELLFEGGEPIKKYEEKGFTPVTTKDFITWKVSGESFTPDPNSFVDTGISSFNREDFETDQAYNEAYQKDRVVLAPRVIPKYGTMYVPIGTGEKSQRIAEDYNKQYGSYKVKKKQLIPYYTPPEGNFEEFEKYRQQQLQAPQQRYGGLFEDGGEVSRMGYRDDSPYRDREYIDIETPTGVIDMSNTGIPLYANGKLLMPYSGQHQMGTNVVREVPVGK